MNLDLLRRQLASIMQQSVASAHGSVVRRMGESFPTADSAFVLFGCGELGKAARKSLSKAGLNVLAFCDNNPARWGSLVDGVPVLSPAEGVSKCHGSNVLVMTVYTNTPLRKQLQSMGVTALSFAELAWCHPDVFLPYQSLELPDKIIQNSRKILDVLGLWADDTSKREYVGQIAWRMSLDPDVLPQHSHTKETYFPPGIFDIKQDEVFVDCGAFDGDSIAAFLRLCKNRFNKIWAIEPDPENYKHLQERIQLYDAEIVRKIISLQAAVGLKRQKIAFNATGTAGSTMGEGSYEVNSIPLDIILKSDTPTYIKMDIEGAEMDALVGAKHVIKKNLPILAVCAYHKQDHLWEIPLLIQSISNDYEFFLRRYSDECWELICYAIPKERLNR
jgi:FkbM family methyltransferase